MSARGALVLACGIGFVAASCSAAQDKEQATLAAVTLGCKVSLDIDRDAGAAGAVDDETQACRKAMRVWQRRP